eukprot:evm.model.scf_1497.2 EVM.evm.TU.scf_1497.2   scf_1497:19028-24291(-)
MRLRLRKHGTGKETAREKRYLRPRALNGAAFVSKKNSGVQRQCFRHKEPSINPFISLLIINLCTAIGSFAVHRIWGNVSGSIWVDAAFLFWLSAVSFSHFWAEGLKRFCQRNERDADELADRDSLFCTIAGIRIHHKVEGWQGRTARTMHLYHGFGTSLWTWEDVQAKLARQCRAVVSAHDMPGFGISDRPQAVAAYSLGFNGRIGRVLMDSMLSGGLSCAQADGKVPNVALKPSAGVASPIVPGTGKNLATTADRGLRRSGSNPILAYYYATQPSSQLGRLHSWEDDQQDGRQRFLVGHSMGCSCAALEALADPGGVDALILVSPAILAVGFPGFGWAGNGVEAHTVDAKVSAMGDKGLREGAESGSGDGQPRAVRKGSLQHGSWQHNCFVNPALRIVGRFMRVGLSLLFLYASAWAVVFHTWIHGTVRFGTRSPSFWNWALRFTFHDKSCITRRKVWSYRRSMYMKGTENGIIPFSLSWLSMHGTGACGDIVDALADPVPSTLCQRLSRMVRKTGLRVLVVQGDKDPSHGNGRRLAAAIPGARLIEYSGCGHNPHEERHERFVQDVANFVNGLA